MGNPTNYMGATMSWYARQMQSYSKGDTKITYKYDSNGLRTEKTVNGVKHEYYYVDGLLRSEQIGESYIMNYRYDTDGKLISVSRYDIAAETSNILYAQTNTRGDVISLYDGAGATRVVYTYDSWGKLVSVTNANGEAIAENSVGDLNSVRYRGYVYDSETGLYYLQSRYYDPEVGRFLNTDSVDYIGYSGEQLSYNAFAYCENGVVNRFDHTGYSYNSMIQSILKFIDLLRKIFSNAYTHRLCVYYYEHVGNFGHVDISIDSYNEILSYGTLVINGVEQAGVGAIKFYQYDNGGYFGKYTDYVEIGLTDKEYSELNNYIWGLYGDVDLYSEYKAYSQGKEINQYKVLKGSYQKYDIIFSNCATFVRDILKNSIKNSRYSKAASLLNYIFVTPKDVFEIAEHLSAD